MFYSRILFFHLFMVLRKVSDKDVRINISGVKDGVIYLPAFSMWRIRRWDYYDKMKDYFARR